MTTAANSYRLGLLGRKVGMMRIFTDDGDAIPVTVLDVSNTVTGTASPSSVKMRIMPTLRPSKPRR